MQRNYDELVAENLNLREILSNVKQEREEDSAEKFLQERPHIEIEVYTYAHKHNRPDFYRLEVQSIWTIKELKDELVINHGLS